MSARTSVVIVGGGIAGLTAAWELTGAGDGPDASTPRIELLEASERLGGVLASEQFAGRVIDLGPDGFLARRPEAVTLARELGLEDRLEPIAASGASIWLKGALEPLPAGLVLGVPTSAKALKAMRGLSRSSRWSVWRDEHVPRKLKITHDVSIGSILRAKLGSELTYQLIEPMVGGIQAGRVDNLSAATVFPALFEAAQRGGSLMKALRPAGGGPSTASAERVLGPLFMSLTSGVGSLASELERQLRERGVVIRTSTAATALRPSPSGSYPFEVDTADTSTGASAVILATPAPVAGRLTSNLHEHMGQLSTIDSAGAAMITFVFNANDTELPASGTGVLIPLGTEWNDDIMMTTALTFLDRKWHHLQRDGEILLRAHVGRIDDRRSEVLGDEALIERVRREITTVLGRAGTPLFARVQRWPQGLPQYYVGHQDLVNQARQGLAPFAIRLAGSAYDGVGIPASIGSGRRAAREVRELLNAGN
ncbi:MAG: protoporphyrinogen oxidase [Acidimicrobiaceae bacterium]|nr:protoporphyrinogen oxidase [Acidimicrobiaceae bacterium]